MFLFALQHYGTHRVGFLFAPIILAWLLCMSAIGLYNIVRWNPQIYQALNPVYMIRFLRKTKKSGWMSLGGILLCMTGKNEQSLCNKQTISFVCNSQQQLQMQKRWMDEHELTLCNVYVCHYSFRVRSNVRGSWTLLLQRHPGNSPHP